MHNKLDNDGIHIHTILASTDCRKHDSETGSPCWSVWLTASDRHAPAVCGSRIRRAGFNGKVDPKSLSRWVGKEDPTKVRSKSRQDRPQKSYSK